MNFSTTFRITGRDKGLKLMIASRRLRNSGEKILSTGGGILAFPAVPAEPDGGLFEFRGPGVRGHDDNGIPEVDCPAVVVGQLAIVHDLEKDIVDVRMSLFELVKQQHAMRVLVHAVCQQSPLVEPDVSWRGSDQPRNGVPFHVLGHVEAVQLDRQGLRQLASDFRLADPGWTREQVVADGFFRFPKAGTRKLDGRRQRLDCHILTKYGPLEGPLEVHEQLAVTL